MTRSSASAGLHAHDLDGFRALVEDRLVAVAHHDGEQGLLIDDGEQADGLGLEGDAEILSQGTCIEVARYKRPAFLENRGHGFGHVSQRDLDPGNLIGAIPRRGRKG